jgi:hypothetical protein
VEDLVLLIDTLAPIQSAGKSMVPIQERVTRPTNFTRLTIVTSIHPEPQGCSVSYHPDIPFITTISFSITSHLVDFRLFSRWCGHVIHFHQPHSFGCKDKELEVVELVLVLRVDADPVVLVASLGTP